MLKCKMGLMGVLLLAATASDGCGAISSPLKEGIENATGQGTSSIDDAIRTLNMDSDKWRSTLEDLVKKLDPKSLLRNEVANLLADSIGVANAGALCSVDYIGERAAKVLEGLVSGHKPPPDLTVCEVVPAVVEFAHWQQGSSPKVDLYGYDLDDPKLEVWLISGKEKKQVSGVLAHTSHYQSAINLGGKGLKLDEHSSKIKVVRKGHFDDPVTEVAIAQPKTPVCDTKTITIKPNALSVKPDAIGAGDNEFDGNGPLMHAAYKLSFKGRKLTARLTLDAIEAKAEPPHPPQDDYTHFRGKQIDSVTTVEKGWKIVSIEGAASSAQKYYAGRSNVEDHVDGGNGPVAEWTFRGDQDGDDLGYTDVTVKMNPIKLVLRQVDDCVPPKTMKK